jgi:molecular chaperone Hsp33
MIERDTLHRFLLETTSVRGEWVHLDACWQALLERHTYPPVVRDRLGEAYAAVALIAATLKFDGSLILQITGSGPLHLLVVQATGNHALRGLARYRAEAFEGEGPQGPALEDVPPGGRLAALFGADARLAITLDPGGGRERYQGVVALEGDSLAVALDHYFERSEQLPTRIWLAADATCAAGMLLQALPGPDGAPTARDAEDWVRATVLGATVTGAELRQQPAEGLLLRLFHEERVRLQEPKEVRFSCNCSRSKVEEMLRGLGADEIRAVLAQEGEVAVTCEFCNARYHFDAVDAEALCVAPEPRPDVGSTRH